MQESEVTNVVRRWVRVALLCQEHSEEEVQTIVKGLDPEFLDKVFRRCTFQMLPGGVRRLLLPDELAGPIDRAASWQSPRRGAARTAGVGSLMARCVGAVPPRRKASSDQAEVLSSAGIRELLMAKKEAKRKTAKEPSLTPVLRNLVFKIVAIDAV